MTTFLEYAREISDGATNTDLARVAGVNKSTVGRWGEGLAPTVDAVRRLAHTYGRPVLEVLVNAGLITPDDVRAREIRVRIEEYPDGVLIRELERRLTRASDPDATISSPAQYGEEPTPDDFDLAAGDIRRPTDPPSA